MKTKEEYEQEYTEYIRAHNLDKIKTKILRSNDAIMNRYQMVNIDCVKHDEGKINVLQYLNSSYQIVYYLKKHKFAYSHGITFKHGMPRHKAFNLENNNWGNLTKACVDIHNYDWFIKQKHARHILEIDPESFYEMQFFIGVFLKDNANHENENKEINMNEEQEQGE